MILFKIISISGLTFLRFGTDFFGPGLDPKTDFLSVLWWFQNRSRPKDRLFISLAVPALNTAHFDTYLGLKNIDNEKESLECELL